MSTQRSLLMILACALGAGVAACGGSGTGSSPSPATGSAGSAGPGGSGGSSSSVPTAAGGGQSASQAISADWTAFFDAKTPAARRISLLQDGQRFAAVIRSQAGSGLAAEASAKVTKVTVTSANQAAVTYTILVGGQPELTGRTGTAVRQGGTWKVGLGSFCGLLSLENGGKTSGLPSVCNSGG